MVKLDLEVIISNSRHKKSMTLVTSKGRPYLQTQSNKVNRNNLSCLTTKFSSKNDSFQDPYMEESFKWLSGVEN